MDGVNADWTESPNLTLDKFHSWVSKSSASLIDVLRSFVYQACLVAPDAEVCSTKCNSTATLSRS